MGTLMTKPSWRLSLRAIVDLSSYRRRLVAMRLRAFSRIAGARRCWKGGLGVVHWMASFPLFRITTRWPGLLFRLLRWSVVLDLNRGRLSNVDHSFACQHRGGKENLLVIARLPRCDAGCGHQKGCQPRDNGLRSASLKSRICGVSNGMLSCRVSIGKVEGGGSAFMARHPGWP